MLIGAIIHGRQIDLPDQGYIKSIWVGVEMSASFLIMLSFLVNIVLFFKHLIKIKSEWKDLLITFIVFIVSFTIWIACMQIDGPTFVSMT